MILDLGVEDEDPVAAEAFGGAGEFVGALVGDGSLRGLGSSSWVEPGGFQVWAFEFGEVDLEFAALGTVDEGVALASGGYDVVGSGEGVDD